MSGSWATSYFDTCFLGSSPARAIVENVPGHQLATATAYSAPHAALLTQIHQINPHALKTTEEPSKGVHFSIIQ